MLLESKTVLIDMMATYFVFDIDYPKAISAVMQHTMFEIRDKQALPGPIL